MSPSYQWRFNGNPIPNQTNSTLSFVPVLPANAGSYDVVSSNNSGSVTSQVATLSVVSFDYGDAPDAGYHTLRANNGARHRLVAGVHLGTTVDVDLDGQSSGLADGDDSTSTDDEDGVLYQSPWVVGQFSSIQVVASTNGFLNAWVDWNHDGTWNTAGDQIFTNFVMVAGTNTLSLLIPEAALAGSGYARYRFDTTGNLLSSGPAADGEVEDYLISVSPRADTGVSIAGPANPVALNSDLMLSIRVTNNGPSIASSVMLTNVVPVGMNFISVSSSQGTCFQSGDKVACDLGTLNKSASVLVVLTLRPVVSGVAGFDITGQQRGVGPRIPQ